MDGAEDDDIRNFGNFDPVYASHAAQLVGHHANVSFLSQLSLDDVSLLFLIMAARYLRRRSMPTLYEWQSRVFC